MRICLRLPYIFIWRSQGNFGQYASVGSPDSFTNTVAKLCKVLPRNPNIVFQHIYQNGVKISIDAKKIRGALVWLKNNNELYYDIEFYENVFECISSEFENDSETQ